MTRWAIPFFTKKGSDTSSSRFAPNSSSAEMAPAPEMIIVLQENFSIYPPPFRV